MIRLKKKQKKTLLFKAFFKLIFFTLFEVKKNCQKQYLDLISLFLFIFTWKKLRYLYEQIDKPSKNVYKI